MCNHVKEVSILGTTLFGNSRDSQRNRRDALDEEYLREHARFHRCLWELKTYIGSMTGPEMYEATR